jgi:hypothetical protein
MFDDFQGFAPRNGNYVPLYMPFITSIHHLDDRTRQDWLDPAVIACKAEQIPEGRVARPPVAIYTVPAGTMKSRDHNRGA